MIYVYHCDICDLSQEIIKSVAEIDSQEYCKGGHIMNRVISWQGQMRVPSFQPMFQPAFGKFIASPHALRDELKKEKYEKGVELVEVGNDRLTTKPKPKEIDMNEVGRDLHQTLRKLRGRTR